MAAFLSALSVVLIVIGLVGFIFAGPPPADCRICRKPIRLWQGSQIRNFNFKLEVGGQPVYGICGRSCVHKGCKDDPANGKIACLSVTIDGKQVKLGE